MTERNDVEILKGVWENDENVEEIIRRKNEQIKHHEDMIWKLKKEIFALEDSGK